MQPINLSKLMMSSDVAIYIIVGLVCFTIGVLTTAYFIHNNHNDKTGEKK